MLTKLIAQVQFTPQGPEVSWGKDSVECLVLGTEEEYSCDTLLLSVGLIPENELSKEMGVKLDNITCGPLVNESLETNIPGVFACGNVLHVHDLVDYVSEEAQRAGSNAAKYVKGKLTDCGSVITLAASDGVRYTVPHQINRDRMEEQLTVRFRVGSVFQNSYISVYFDRERVMHRKKQVMAPGEMEQVILQKQKLAAYPKLEHITIKIEKE